MVSLSSGAAGKLFLSGDGASEAAEMAAISIAPVDSSKIAKVTFDLYPATITANACRYHVQITGTSFNLESRGSNSLQHVAIRSPDELPKLFRLNWVPSTNALVSFYNLFTYIEA